MLLSHVCADADMVFQYITLNMLAFMLVIEMFQSRHAAAHSYVDPAIMCSTSSCLSSNLAITFYHYHCMIKNPTSTCFKPAMTFEYWQTRLIIRQLYYQLIYMYV